MESKVQIWFDNVMCFVDIENRVVYSAKLKKLKPQHIKRHISDYYMIKYNTHKSYKPIEFLIGLAREKLQHKDR